MRALVLHGYRGNPYVNWYPWMTWKLRKRGYKTWAPKLPNSSFPNGHVWTSKLLKNKDWNYEDCLIIGHSAGSVEILNLLSNLPDDVKVGTAVLVSSFRPRSDWPALKNLVPEPFDFAKIKTKAKRFILVHAKNDKLCPVDDARYYARQLEGELIVLPDGGHFSILRNIRFWRFTKLLKILEEKKVL